MAEGAKHEGPDPWRCSDCFSRGRRRPASFGGDGGGGGGGANPAGLSIQQLPAIPKTEITAQRHVTWPPRLACPPCLLL